MTDPDAQESSRSRPAGSTLIQIIARSRSRFIIDLPGRVGMDEAQHLAVRRLLDAGACDEEVSWSTGATLLEIIGLRAALAVAFPRPERPRPHGSGLHRIRPAKFSGVG